MNVLQHTRNELNLCLKKNRPDRSYRDTLLIAVDNRSYRFFDVDSTNTDKTFQRKISKKKQYHKQQYSI